MTTETVPTKPILISAYTSTAVVPKPTVPAVAASAEKDPVVGKNGSGTPAVPAVDPKVEVREILLKDLALPESSRRAVAAEALGRLADNETASALIDALRDADVDVAHAAALSLGSLGGSASVEALLGVVTNEDGYFHSVVRAAAARSLGKLGNKRAIDPLLTAIQDPSSEVSAEAIGSLALLPDPRSVPALLEVVRNAKGFFLPSTRHAAILGLAQAGGKQAVFELRFVASNQWEDASIRAAAIEAVRNSPAASAGA